MQYNIYSVYDKTAEEFGPPFVAVNDGVAKRQYKNFGIPEALQDEYELHCIGTFDSKDGSVLPIDTFTLHTEEVANAENI